MRMELHDKGLVLSAPEIPGEPSEAVRRASGGPIFSALPEKMGEKRGAWLRLVPTASEFRQETDILELISPRHTSPCLTTRRPSFWHQI